eukprot:CAMPEP_0117032286 /NCGR_PEP_ID=MMETSP0472-20121206/23147_1 /TAXON_ID=693140 ORGANISM="Tiarina fusus, Strain LIS" /NCGR_SAMPLE_ID=MMETSP0472 /ASSEMBLY_ACC=CAM_ASM_000603 /LENGTH=193 /DNA_ID=CAMNT_0004740865 /DNA_START=28 /DNA_END=609 /DNA_ORIENTATION=+
MAMVTGDHKIKKAAGKEVTDFEKEVAQAMYQIEMSTGTEGAELKPLHIVGARELPVGDSGRKAMIVFVPFNLLNDFRKVERMLIVELEKKFGDYHVVLVAQRTILSKHATRSKRVTGKRPNSRTLTAVHEAILDDLVFPADIVGKRTRFFTDGSKLLTVFLSARDRVQLEAKLPALEAVYAALTTKRVNFEFA